MKTFLHEKRRSAGYARDRMKLLLISERIECSPQMWKILKVNLVPYCEKVCFLEESKVKIQISSGAAGSYGVHSCAKEKGQIDI